MKEKHCLLLCGCASGYAVVRTPHFHVLISDLNRGMSALGRTLLLTGGDSTNSFGARMTAPCRSCYIPPSTIFVQGLGICLLSLSYTERTTTPAARTLQSKPR